MKSDDKWLLFKQYLHNELGITKEDIRNWVEKAVQDEARRMVDKTYAEFSVERFLKNEIYSNDYYRTGFKQDVINELAKDLSERIEIKTK